VRPTNTTLSVRGERVGETRVRISGELATSDGLAIPGQTVQLSISESIERSVEPDRNGTYALLVQQSELPDGTNTSLLVTAAFSGEGTNLESTSTTKRLTFEPLITGESQSGGPETGPSGVGGSFDWLLIVIGVLAGGAVLALSWRYFRSPSSSDGDTDRAIAESVANTDELETLDLSHGQSLADERPETAVLWTYQNVREYLAGLTGAEDSDTHWEFYTKCQQQNLDEAQLSKLQDLVVAYETVRFHRSDTDIDVNARTIVGEPDWQQR
jgi:hypothetical protein